MNTAEKVKPNPERFDHTERNVSVAQNLAISLADTYQALVTTQNYHWNVEGRMFKPLHELFESQYRSLFTAVDEIAERVRALGFYSPGSFEEFKNISTVEPLVGTRDPEVMVQSLIRMHELIVTGFKRVADISSRTGDIGTEDLAVSRVRDHEKMIWMLRSTAGVQAKMETRPN